MGVLIRVSKVEVGYDEDHKIELEGVDSITWKESDPWVPIEIPGADRVTIFQHIKPILTEVTLVCFDVDSIKTVFYETDIQDAPGDQYAITATGRRNKIEYFRATGVVVGTEDSEKTYSFTNMRIRNIEFPELTKNEAKPEPFTIHFYADSIDEVE